MAPQAIQLSITLTAGVVQLLVAGEAVVMPGMDRLSHVHDVLTLRDVRTENSLGIDKKWTEKVESQQIHQKVTVITKYIYIYNMC